MSEGGAKWSSPAILLTVANMLWALLQAANHFVADNGKTISDLNARVAVLEAKIEYLGRAK